jgi:hypothetical protein
MVAAPGIELLPPQLNAMEIRRDGIFTRDREIVEIVRDQKDGTQIAPGRSPLKDLSVCREVGDLIAVSDGYGKSDAHLHWCFSVSESFSWVIFIARRHFRYR